MVVAMAPRYSQASLILKISNGARCTTNRLVTLNYNMCTPQRPCPRGIKYRASEDPNFRDAQWRTTRNSWVYFTLSNAFGQKTVYFQVGGPNFTPVRDQIDYLGSCEDPRFMERMNVTISRLHAPFTFDAAYNFRVSDVQNKNDFEIVVRAVIGKRQRTIASTPSLNYASGMPDGNNAIRHVGTLTIPVGGQDSPAHSAVTIIADIKPKPGVANIQDYDPNNNRSYRSIQLVSRPQERNHVVRECIGPEGSKNNILSPVGNAWVSGQSTLMLHDCGGFTTSNERKCDNNPLPAVGLRGVKWTRRPSTGGQYGLHWYCEGLANRRDNSTYGYYFRFTVRYPIIELRVQ